MASSSAHSLAFLAISMVLLSSVAMAADIYVGGDNGWGLGFNYTEWAEGQVFRVGDNLVFKYDNTKHNVVKVNATQFQSCNSTADNAVFTSGLDSIPLKAEGPKWYICSKPTHCSDHLMKLVINVEAAAPAPAPSSAISLFSSLSLSGLFVAIVAAIFA